MSNQNLINLNMRQTHRSGIFSMKTLFTALLLQLFMLPLFAQVKNVTGVVKDQSGETVIAASVDRKSVV